MKKTLTLLALLSIVNILFAQDQCAPVGWGTENGGVTGGGNATPVVCDTYSELAAALDDESVRVVHIDGTITFGSGDRITIQDQSDKTIFGLPGSRLVSTDLTSSGSGIFYIKRVQNLIIQNLVFEGPGAYDEDGYDNLCIDNCQNVWVDHCDFQDGMDGNFDIKNMSDYVSVTWCIFQYNKPPIAGGSGGSNDHRYTNLIGSSASATGDRNKLNTTFQFCWWGDGCRERMPRVRFGKIHLLNSYFSSSVSNYCARAGEEANILVEGCYFDDQNEPVDLYRSNAIVAENNNISTGGSISTQNAGSVFDPPYSYVVADPGSIVTQIETCAGATLSSWGGCSACAGGVNIPPSVSITDPSDGAVFAPGEIITLSATAFDSDGSVVSVTFYDGTNVIGTVTSGYSVTWSGASEGVHTISAVALDDEGAEGTSAEVTVTFSSAYTISVTSGGSAGIVQPDVSGTYYAGEELTVTAVEYIGSQFAGWSGDITSAESVLTFTVSGHTDITANFEAGTSNTFEMEDGNYESGIADFESDNGGYSGSGYVNTANELGTWTEITVYAAAAGTYSVELFYAAISDRAIDVAVNGSVQTNISGTNTGDWSVWESQTFTLDIAEGANVIRFIATGGEGAPNLDKIVVTSGSSMYNLIVNQVAGGTITPSSGNYAEGANVSVSAIANTGYVFSNWTGDLSGNANPATIVMDSDKIISAVFTPQSNVFHVNLHAGWNLIGYPLDETVDISVALSAIWDKVLIVKNDEGYYIPSQAPMFNSLTELQRGRGYMIKVSEDCGFDW